MIRNYGLMMKHPLPALTTLSISRAQFALAAAFHIAFPSVSVGLLLFLVLLKLLLLNFGPKAFKKSFNLFTKIFSIAFALGTISGIALSFQLGMNWTVFYSFAGHIINQLLAYEVLLAFFLEAGFLGIMLFGQKAVGPTAHLLSIILVGAGSVASAFWITSANSWMQTPKGFVIMNSKAVPTNWLLIILNPSFFFRFAHALMATIISSVTLIISIYFWQLPVDCNQLQNSIMVPTLLKLLAILVVTQVVLGDLHGLHLLKYQPQKISAIEAFWRKNKSGVPLNLVCLISSKTKRNVAELSVPRIGSLVLTHSLVGTIFSIEDFKKHCCPNVTVLFSSFRLMLSSSVALMLFGLMSLLHAETICLNPLILLSTLATTVGPVGYVSLLSGWVTAEMGRQPWAVFGLLRTAQSVTNVPYTIVWLSFCTSVLLYSTILCFGAYYLVRCCTKDHHNKGLPTNR